MEILEEKKRKRYDLNIEERNGERKSGRPSENHLRVSCLSSVYIFNISGVRKNSGKRNRLLQVLLDTTEDQGHQLLHKDRMGSTDVWVTSSSASANYYRMSYQMIHCCKEKKTSIKTHVDAVEFRRHISNYESDLNCASHRVKVWRNQSISAVYDLICNGHEFKRRIICIPLYFI